MATGLQVYGNGLFRSTYRYRFSIFVYCLTTSLISTSLPVAGHRILIVPIAGLRSHMFSLQAISERLSELGHDVVIIVGRNFPLSAVDTKTGNGSVTYERCDNDTTNYEAVLENLTFAAMNNQLRMNQMVSIVGECSKASCRQLFLHNEPFLRRLEQLRFDLVIVDSIYFMKCLYLVPHRLGLPFISYVDVLDPFLVRVPWLPSFVPSAVTTFTDSMHTFAQRMKNTLVAVGFWLFNPYQDQPEEVFDEYRSKYGNFRSLNDLAEKSLLWLYTRDHIIDYARPLMPHVIPVGGLTVPFASSADQKQPLPPELQQFIDGAQLGTIVVSFGSMASIFPETIIVKFSDAFRRLGNGYRIVWRLNNVDHVRLPENVLAMRWIPQKNLLADHSVRLFITHCGNNGHYEAVYHGVPMIGFPLIGDQDHNAARLTRKGFGLVMDMYSFTSDDLLANIQHVIEDPSYKKRVVWYSKLLRSDSQTPAQRASFWIDHVIRFGGEHLRSGGADLPLYAYWLLDVFVVLVVLASLAIFIVLKLLKPVLRMLFKTFHFIYAGKTKRE